VTCNNELFNGSITKEGRRSDHFELDTEMFVYKVELLGTKDQDDWSLRRRRKAIPIMIFLARGAVWILHLVDHRHQEQ
jgi:hypothetical protein